MLQRNLRNSLEFIMISFPYVQKKNGSHLNIENNRFFQDGVNYLFHETYFKGI